MFDFLKRAPKQLEPNFANGDANGFWCWFKKCEAAFARELSQSFGADSFAGDMIFKALRLFESGLMFELGRIDENKFELVISADGVSENFPAVLSLIKAKPESDFFIFTAFRQRGPVPTVEINGIKLSQDTVFFHIRRSQEQVGRIDLGIIPGDSILHEEFAFQATLLLIQCSIGEYDMATMIGSIELLDDTAKAGSELKLCELSDIIDGEILLRMKS